MYLADFAVKYHCSVDLFFLSFILALSVAIQKNLGQILSDGGYDKVSSLFVDRGNYGGLCTIRLAKRLVSALKRLWCVCLVETAAVQAEKAPDKLR